MVSWTSREDGFEVATSTKTPPPRLLPAGLLEEREHRILTHVRVDGDAGCAVDTEMRPGVGGGHGADVPALYVRYCRQAQVLGGLDQAGIDPHPGGTQTLEERGLKLYGGDVGLHSLEDAQAELQGRFGLGQERSSSGKREGMGSRPATSTLSLRRAASTSACIVPRLAEKSAKKRCRGGKPAAPVKTLWWLLDLVL